MLMKPEKKTPSREKGTARSTTQSAAPKTPHARLRPVAAKADAAAAPAAGPKPARKPALKIPPILLEGDEPSLPGVSGPGQRYALGPTPPPEHSGPAGETAELPEAYGTKKLLLAARDPHWLYAHWDFSREQLRDYNGKSTDGHLILRVYKNDVGGDLVNEIHVHPESKNWFVN